MKKESLILLVLVFIVVGSSACYNTNKYLGASNYNLERQDFVSPTDTEEDLDVALTPKFVYATGIGVKNRISRNLYGGGVQGTALYKDFLYFGLGAGHQWGDVSSRFLVEEGNPPDVTNRTEARKFSTSAWNTNAVLGYRIAGDYLDYYPVIISANAGGDAGEYLDFRKNIPSNYVDEILIDTSSLFSYEVGTKLLRHWDDGRQISYYIGFHFSDESTRKTFGEVDPSVVFSTNYVYRNFLMNLNSSLGEYTGIGMGAGYRIE